MEIIDQFFSRLSVDCAEIKNNVWDKTQLFLDKMSAFYSKKKDVKEVKIESVKETQNVAIDDKRSSVEKENDMGKKQVDTIVQELEFDSIVTIAGYLDHRYRDNDILIEFVGNHDFYGKSYQKNLSNLSEEILELKEKYVKGFRKKDRDELIDGFVSKFLKVIRTNLFETVYDNIYRCSLTNDNNTLIVEFKNLIDEFMEKAGFSKRELEIGEMFDSKICSSENPEYTDNPMLHKTIKSIVWPPYILTYFSYAEGKQVKKIIKGKVICYSSKI